FNAPADLNFADAFSKVRMRVHLSLHEDETSNFSHWHIPQAHYLESWSDARAFDGTVSIIQPLILPLYGGKSMHELMAVLLEDAGKSDYDIVKETWRGKVKDGEFEKFWRKTLHDGVMAGTALPQKKMRLRPQKRKLNLTTASGSSAGDLEVAFRPDPTIWDGRYANNGWLQELPKPLTKLTWDNAVMLSPQTAEKLQVENEDLVELRYGGRTVRGAVWILPGQPDGTVTVHFGHGRERVGQVGQRTGFNAYALRRVDAPWFDRGLQVHKTGEKSRLATTQHHHNMENRHLVRSGTLAEFLAHPEFVREMGEDPPPEMTLYPRFEYKGYAWGMAVDLNACIGCNACVVACQSENNIPVVGKDQVARGREMHWIRIDRYYEGELESPETLHQPVMCMHCEDAPCEVVCPVGATTHSPEGLNEMVYNRCVGTRYCSNNCPYKVRRFNFYHYADYETPSLKLMRNPDVTVRTRGVMEKCTYCVQRINQARITAEKEDRSLRDGEIVTACQQVCPTDAIVFGDINDPQSRVARLKAEERNYGILTELGTRPRTSYLARIRNPNPDIEKA
ncbi:MAG: 4Fe-4S dicluster domain-containing protein, partial [Calditrichaeota bacterium]